MNCCASRTEKLSFDPTLKAFRINRETAQLLTGV